MPSDFDQLLREIGEATDNKEAQFTKALSQLIDIAKSQNAEIKKLKRQVRDMSIKDKLDQTVSVVKRNNDAVQDGSDWTVEQLFAKALERQMRGEPLACPIGGRDIALAEAAINNNQQPSADFIRRVVHGF